MFRVVKSGRTAKLVVTLQTIGVRHVIRDTGIQTVIITVRPVALNVIKIAGSV